MSVTIDVAISAQLALQKRLDTIADNVANTNTAGFRAELIKFDSVLSRFTDNPVQFASDGESYLSAKTGAFIQSDNPLDLAIKGLLIGLCTMPGAYTGRWIVTNTPIRLHTAFMEIFILCGAGYFLWQAAVGLGWW